MATATERTTPEHFLIPYAVFAIMTSWEAIRSKGLLLPGLSGVNAVLCGGIGLLLNSDSDVSAPVVAAAVGILATLSTIYEAYDFAKKE